MDKFRFAFCCAVVLALMAATAVSAKQVAATKNGRTAFETGLQVVCKGDCWTNVGSQTQYETVLTDVPCYSQLYNIAFTWWSVSNYGAINGPLDSCKQIVWDVSGPCHFSALAYRESGTKYFSNAVVCSKCYAHTQCTEIADSSSESYTFDVYQPCPNKLTVTHLEGTATADGSDVSDGGSFPPDAVFKTGPNSKMELTYPDGSIVRMGENSSIKPGCDENPANQIPVNIRITLLLGKVWSKVTKAVGSDRQFNVSTERSGGGVRGTEFEVEVLSTVDRYQVGEGKVEVTNIAGTDSIKIGKCQAVQVDNNGVITEIDPYPSENISCGAAVRRPLNSALHKNPTHHRLEYYSLSGRRIVFPSGNRRAGLPGQLLVQRTVNDDGAILTQKIVLFGK
jgi:hypothetical protein